MLIKKIFTLLLVQISCFAFGANYYWIGNSGNWSQISHWATTTGGSTVHSSVPGANDNVIFDANSFTVADQYVNMDVSGVCKSMAWDSVNFKPSLKGNSPITIWGNLTFGNPMGWGNSGVTNFVGTATYNLNLNGNGLSDVSFNCSGTYNITSTFSCGKFSVQKGNVNSNNQLISCERILCTGGDTASLKLGTSQITVYAYLPSNQTYLYGYSVYFYNANLTLDADSCEFLLIGSGYNIFYTYQSNATYDDISVSAGYYFEYYGVQSKVDSMNLTFNGNSIINTTDTINYLNCGNSYCFLSGSSKIKQGSFSSTLNLQNYSKVIFDKCTILGQLITGLHSITSSTITAKYCSVQGDVTLGADASFDTLRLIATSGSPIYTFKSGDTCFVKDSFQLPIGNCSFYYSMKSSLAATRAVISKNTGTVVSNYCHMSSIRGSGGATFTAQNVLSDNGLNSGWTINLLTSFDLYWVGGNGNWGDPTKWSLTSGGTPQSAGGCVPVPNTNVYFDANSFSATGQKVTINLASSCKNMTWTGALYSPELAGAYTLDVFGNLTGNVSMSWTQTSYINFKGITSHTVDFKGNGCASHVRFMGSGSYSLADSITTTNSVQFLQGKIYTNNHGIRCPIMASSGNDSVYVFFGTSIINIYRHTTYANCQASFSNLKMVLDADQCTFIFGGVTSPNTSYFNCNTYQIFGSVHFLNQNNVLNVNYGTNCYFDSITAISANNSSYLYDRLTAKYIYINGKLRIQGTNTYVKKAIVTGDLETTYNMKFDTLVLTNSGGPRIYTFQENSTITITDSISFPIGGCGEMHTLRSNTLSNPPTLYKNGGTVKCNFYSLQNVKTGGTASFQQLNNNATYGTVTGWTITSAGSQSLYWVGGTGNWDDPTKWSLTSGGSPQSSSGCIPTPVTNVYFNASSFSNTGQTITINSVSNCKSMNWSNVTNSPTFAGSSEFYIYRNLIADSSIIWSNTSPLYFRSDSAFSIDFASLNIANELNIQTKKKISLLDDIKTSSNIFMRSGFLYTGNYNITCNKIEVYSYDSISLYLGTSSLTSTFDSAVQGYRGIYFGKITKPFLIDADSASFKLETAGNSANYSGIYCSETILLKSFTSNMHSYIDYGISSNIKSSISENDAYLGGGFYINKCIVNGNFSSGGNLEFDSLYLTKSDGTPYHVFASNATCKIYDSLYIASSGCFKAELNCTKPSLQATLYIPSTKSFVSDFMSIQNIKATGGVFNAGANSNDLGNNSGWIFTGSTYTLSLKFNFVCLDKGTTKLIKLVPDGQPTNFWWQETIDKLDTFYTGLDTLTLSDPAEYLFISEYGPNCYITDSVIIRYNEPAQGLSQIFYNNAEDENWFNCSNWDLGYIPDSISDATIDIGDTVRILPGDTAYCFNLTIQGVFEMTGGVIYVYGDLLNEGVIYQNGGQIIMAGDAKVVLGGKVSPYFDSLEINKTAGFVNIEIEVYITGYVNFVNGLMFASGSNTLYFEDTASSNEGNANSFVDGPVVAKSGTGFIFPIGKNNIWARIGVINPSNTTTEFTAEYFDEMYSDTTNYNSPLVRISGVEHWILDRTAGSGTATVRLYYEDSIRSGISDTASLTVAKYNGSSWDDKQVVHKSHSNGTGFITSNSVTSFSPFTFGSTTYMNYLPIELSSLDAAWQENDAKIMWATASAINNSHFEIERSLTGHTFEKVGTVYAKSISSISVETYTFLDKNAYLSTPIRAYYRLKQVDLDGISTYTNVVVLTKKLANQDFSYFPNPTSGVITINTYGASGELTINNLAGSTLLIHQIGKDESTTQIDLSGYRKGVYFIQFQNSDKVLTKKIVIN